MFKTIRFALGIVLILVIAIAGLRWVLGDDFQSWVNAGRSQLKNPLTKIVDEYQMKYEKAKIKVQDAKETARELRVSVQKQKVAVGRLERQVVEGRNSILAKKQELELIRDPLSDGRDVFFVSGAKAESTELRDHIEMKGQQIAIAEEKLSLIDPMLQLRRKKLAQLQAFEKSAPSSIRRMVSSLDLLATKLDMYRDVRKLWDEEAAGQIAMDGLFAEAKKALEEAHYELDFKLAEFDAMVDMSLEIESSVDATLLVGEDITEMIDSIVGITALNELSEK